MTTHNDWYWHHVQRTWEEEARMRRRQWLAVAYQHQWQVEFTASRIMAIAVESWLRAVYPDLEVEDWSGTRCVEVRA